MDWVEDARHDKQPQDLGCILLVYHRKEISGRGFVSSTESKKNSLVQKMMVHIKEKEKRTSGKGIFKHANDDFYSKKPFFFFNF